MSKRELVEKALREIIAGKTIKSMGQDTTDLPSNKIQIEQILGPDFMNATPYAQSNVINVPDDFNGIKVNYQAGNFLGGLQAQWVNEGAVINIDKDTFGSRTIGMCKLAISVPLTGEINQDVVYLSQYLTKAITKAIRYEVNRSIIYGEQCVKGIVGAGKEATGFVDISTYNTIEKQIEEMYSMYYGSDVGVWIFSKDKYRELVAAYAVDTSVDSPWGRLYGLPIVVAPYMLAGDVVLGDFAQYWIAQKEMRQSISESVYFLTDELCLRMILRIGGRTPFADGWTNADGYKVYPFVALSDMEQSSEEFQSSSSSSSSSESSASSLSSQSSNSSSSQSSSSSSSSSSQSSESSSSESSSSESSESSESSSSSSLDSSSSSSSSGV